MTQPYAPQPWTPPSTPAHRRRRNPAPFIIVAVVILALLIAGAVYAFNASSTITIKGSLTIQNNIDGGKTCQGGKGFDDIRGGTSVVVHDAGGRTIATGQLDDGVGSNFATSEMAMTCRFSFTVTGVPKQRFYGIEVSHRGTVTFTAKQVAAGKIMLSLGES